MLLVDASLERHPGVTVRSVSFAGEEDGSIELASTHSHRSDRDLVVAVRDWSVVLPRSQKSGAEISHLGCLASQFVSLLFDEHAELVESLTVRCQRRGGALNPHSFGSFLMNRHNVFKLVSGS